MHHVREFEDNAPSLGIDLGLKSVVALSNGFKIAAPDSTGKRRNNSACFNGAGRRFAQGAGGENRQQHFLHVVSHGLVRHYGEIDVGDVSAKKRAKTRMAKSVHDARCCATVVQVDCDRRRDARRSRTLQFPNVLGLWVHSRQPPERVGCAWSEAVEMRCGRDVAASRHQRCSEYRNCRGGTSPPGSGNPRPYKGGEDVKKNPPATAFSGRAKWTDSVVAIAIAFFPQSRTDGGAGLPGSPKEQRGATAKQRRRGGRCH
jgi:hypothetical protein